MRVRSIAAVLLTVGCCCGAGAPLLARDGGAAPDAIPTFVNWETPQVFPVDQTPDHTQLLVCNTAAGTLDVFSTTGPSLQLIASIPVGVDPVAVRAFDNNIAWVVNHVSDSVNIVDLSALNVVRSLHTLDEPCDVVFAGSPVRAFVSCSQVNTLQVFDPSNLDAPSVSVPIDGEDPRSLAVSPDGQRVYAAIFESGNRSTILSGGSVNTRLTFPPNVVSNPAGPYAGVNPPPNVGNAFVPAQRAGNAAPPKVGLIVKKDGAGKWMDDNAHDWTNFVSGSSASSSGRPQNWDLPDHDLAVIDASTLSVAYANSLMNICMAVSVNPATGTPTVIGTDATNQIRFEPNLTGTFLRVNLATVNPATLTPTITDLNPHLTYATSSVPPSERAKSIGDPRAIVWDGAGLTAFVAGMGSNNVVVIDRTGARSGAVNVIDVPEGPTGLAMDESRGRLYVLSRFAGTVSTIDLATRAVVDSVSLFDPTPSAIRLGRKHFFGTQTSSGLGQLSCASCHVDARTDRLAWDLGDPSGTVDPLTGRNLGFNFPGLEPNTANPGFAPFHPMKGPMLTQTLQDIIGHEPHHWRGDRLGLEAFSGAFVGLQGRAAPPSASEMQEFENFLATITFPPNPNRNFDNSLPTSLPLPGLTRPGRFGNAGQPMPNGNAVNGLALYTGSTGRRLDLNVFSCVQCHTIPTGMGPDAALVGSPFSGFFQPIGAGPNGEHHLGLVSVDGSSNVSMKIPQLRNLFERTGCDYSKVSNSAGFGMIHDGSVDTLARFVAEPAFSVQSDQEIADLVAFMYCLTGGGLPQGSVNTPFFPPGPPSLETHAAVGRQTTLVSAGNAEVGQLALIASMIQLANSGKVGLIVTGIYENQRRGFAYVGENNFQSDRAGQVVTAAQLQAAAAPQSELTYTVVVNGLQTRLGIDRDLDGTLNGDECRADINGDGVVDLSDFFEFFNCFDQSLACADIDGVTGVDLGDFFEFFNRFDGGCLN